VSEVDVVQVPSVEIKDATFAGNVWHTIGPTEIGTFKIDDPGRLVKKKPA